MAENLLYTGDTSNDPPEFPLLVSAAKFLANFGDPTIALRIGSPVPGVRLNLWRGMTVSERTNIPTTRPAWSSRAIPWRRNKA